MTLDDIRFIMIYKNSQEMVVLYQEFKPKSNQGERNGESERKMCVKKRGREKKERQRKLTLNSRLELKMKKKFMIILIWILDFITMIGDRLLVVTCN